MMQFDKALELLNNSYTLRKQAVQINYIDLAACIVIIANILLEIGHKEQAFIKIDEALSILRKYCFS